jgi:hypothetical protein
MLPVALEPVQLSGCLCLSALTKLIVEICLCRRDTPTIGTLSMLTTNVQHAVFCVLQVSAVISRIVTVLF